MATPGTGLERSLLPNLARSMTASLGLGEVLAAASRTAIELVPDSIVLVWVLHADRLVLRDAAGVLEGTHTGLRTDLAVGEGLAGHVAGRRQPLIVDDPAHDPRATQPAFLLAERVRWFVGLPLSARYALEGVLAVFSRGAEPPAAEVLEALGELAAQAALAVESARLDAHGQRRRREAEALAAVGQALAYSLNPHVVAQLIADSVIALLDARDGAVYRLEPATGELIAIAFAGRQVDSPVPLVLPPGAGLAGRAVLERRLLSTRNALDDPRVVYPEVLRERFQRLDLEAVMAAPLLVNGEPIGALGVAAGRATAFDDEARRLLEAFADQAAIALNNARLFAAERGARAQAEAAEQRFRGLVESIDGVVAEFDVATRQVLFVSPQAEALLGYPLASWTAEPDFWRERLHPADRGRVWAFTRAEAAAGRNHVQEYRMLAADGRVVWVRDSASLVREPDRPPRLRCLQVDITGRKRTEALLDGEKRVLETIAAGQPLTRVLDTLCRAVESQGDGMLCSVLLVEGDRLRAGAAPSLPRAYVEAVDGAPLGPDGGASGAAVFHRRPVIVEDIALDAHWAHGPLALAHGLRACWSVPVLDADGTPLAAVAIYFRTPRRPGEADRRPIERLARLAGIAIERVRAAEALRASEHRYRTLVTNIPDVVWLVDRAGNTLFLSPHVETIGGYTAEELYRAGSAGWFGRIHPDDLPLVRQHFATLFQDKGGTFDVEYRLRHRDGRWVWLHARAVATYEGPDTTYVYGLSSNITDRKQAEEIRALLLNQVITVQEEERRRIARELHDETAQSLASLLLGLSALQEARTLRAARTQAGDLHRVATRALAEVRRLAWGLRPAVLDDLGLATALERYAQEFGRTRGITVAVDSAGLAGGRLPAVVETSLYRIMQEALSNVARHAGARKVRVQLERRDATIALVVEDDGQGFDPAQPPARPTAARGLGIHSMRERAAVHRGALAIDSAPGRGTRVSVEIPVAAGPA
ncbi:MAG TPA: GAF domain-containing protein [Methylomirabilota bacterium]